MPGLWRYNKETPEGKYLVKRRDGTVPRWPWFVFGGADMAAPTGLIAYANEAERLGFDPAYVADVRSMVSVFEDWLKTEGAGDPDAPRHRVDDPATVAEMRKGRGA